MNALICFWTLSGVLIAFSVLQTEATPIAEENVVVGDQNPEGVRSELPSDNGDNAIDAVQPEGVDQPAVTKNEPPIDDASNTAEKVQSNEPVDVDVDPKEATKETVDVLAPEAKDNTETEDAQASETEVLEESKADPPSIETANPVIDANPQQPNVDETSKEDSEPVVQETVTPETVTPEGTPIAAEAVTTTEAQTANGEEKQTITTDGSEQSTGDAKASTDEVKTSAEKAQQTVTSEDSDQATGDAKASPDDVKTSAEKAQTVTSEGSNQATDDVKASAGKAKKVKVSSDKTKQGKEDVVDVVETCYEVDDCVFENCLSGTLECLRGVCNCEDEEEYYFLL